MSSVLVPETPRYQSLGTGVGSSGRVRIGSKKRVDSKSNLTREQFNTEVGIQHLSYFTSTTAFISCLTDLTLISEFFTVCNNNDGNNDGNNNWIVSTRTVGGVR